MPTTYYEQGRQDAEKGSLNQLFYHTYHDYKRGYDEVMQGAKTRRWLFPLVGLGIFLAGLGGGWVLRDQGVLATETTTTPVVVTATVPVPTATFAFAIATPAPTAPPTAVPDSRIGSTATVETGGSNLRVRAEPTTDAAIVTSLANGTAVTLIGGPQEAGGYTWWQIQTPQGEGWAAADFLRFTP